MDSRDVTAVVTGFARTLRAAGVPASTDRLLAFTDALAALDPRREQDVYWAGRLTLCADPDHLDRYHRAFAAYFGGHGIPPSPPRVRTRSETADAGATGDRGEDEGIGGGAVASTTELLRHRDVAAMTAEQRAELARLLVAFRITGEVRRTRRHRPARRGDVDRARTVRDLLRRGGEPALLRRRSRATRPRRVVLLVDVSGSMTPYAAALLRFSHAASRQRTRTEVFTLGTRLTRVSAQMVHRDPDLAMATVAEAVPDWAGGTRLGALLKEFLDRWGQQGMARGAVVVVLSDGWERDDPALLAAQMGRLSRLAHRVVWANPRKGREGYEPLAAGMAAALPYIDDFVEGHSLAALERLAATVAGGADRRA